MGSAWKSLESSVPQFLLDIHYTRNVCGILKSVTGREETLICPKSNLLASTSWLWCDLLNTSLAVALLITLMVRQLLHSFNQFSCLSVCIP